MYFLHLSLSCHSDWLFHGECCPCLDVVRPGGVWSSSACAWHCSLHYLFPGNSLVSSWCDHSMLASVLWQCLTLPSSSIPALLRTHSFVSFAVHETRRNLSKSFHLKSRRRVSSFFLSVQISQATLALSLVVSSLKSVCCDFYIFCSDASIACPLFNLVRNSVVISPSSVIRDPRYGNVSTCSSSSF